jgi:hypothetical protein
MKATRGYATPATRSPPFVVVVLFHLGTSISRPSPVRPPLPSRDLDFKTWSCPSVEVLKPRLTPERTDRRTDTM